MKPELIDFVEKFKGKRILIIGDMIADIYLKVIFLVFLVKRQF